MPSAQQSLIAPKSSEPSPRPLRADKGKAPPDEVPGGLEGQNLTLSLILLPSGEASHPIS